MRCNREVYMLRLWFYTCYVNQGSALNGMDFEKVIWGREGDKLFLYLPPFFGCLIFRERKREIERGIRLRGREFSLFVRKWGMCREIEREWQGDWVGVGVVVGRVDKVGQEGCRADQEKDFGLLWVKLDRKRARSREFVGPTIRVRDEFHKIGFKTGDGVACEDLREAGWAYVW